MQKLLQNGVLEPQNAFRAPKCSLAKRGQGDYTSFATAVEENDMSKMMKSMRKRKLAKVRMEKTDLDLIFSWITSWKYSFSHLAPNSGKPTPNGINLRQNRENRSFDPTITFRAKITFDWKMGFLEHKGEISLILRFEQKVLFGTLTNSHTLSQFCDSARADPEK